MESVDRQVLLILQRMMNGERLTVTEVGRFLKLKKKAARSRLMAIADVLGQGRKSDPAPGEAAEFWWDWPKSERVPNHVVWSLAAARRLLEHLADTSIGTTLDRLLRDAISRHEGARALPGDLSRMFHAHNLSVRSRVDPDVVDDLIRAVYDQREITYKYQSSRSASLEETVEPWCLVMGDEGLYLYGRCTDSPRADRLLLCRLYVVARIKEVRETGERFAYPARPFDPATLFGHSFGIFLPAENAPPPSMVVLRFSPDQRGFFEHHQIHPNQDEPVSLPDGRVEVRAELHITYDLVRWVRGFGDEVEVVEPPVLKTWVESQRGASMRKELGL